MQVFNSILLGIVFFILFIIGIFIVSIIFWVLYYRIFKHMKKIKGSYKYIGYGSKLKRIFVDFPKQYAYDILNKNPDEFQEFGFHLITGKQGKGKTITLVYLLLRYQQMYPKLKVKTNMAYKYEDGSIDSWQDLVFSNNGIFGEIDVIDEVQNWFSSNQSRNFPPDMLSEITQQRKQKKMIIGTSQVFTRVAKPIRENVYMVYQPITLFGCITFVKKFEPVINDDGIVKENKMRGVFFFVHNKKIRDAFDTYKKITNMATSGFIDNSDRIALTADNTINVSTTINNSKK